MFGTGDWLLFWGLSFVACLPQLFQLFGHRSVPESQVINRRTFLRATSTMTSTPRSTRNYEDFEESSAGGGRIGTHLAGEAGFWTTVMIDCSVRLLMMSDH